MPNPPDVYFLILQKRLIPSDSENADTFSSGMPTAFT